MKRIFQKGFTVLEFLVVIAIIAILVGLILVGLAAARAHARDQVRVSNIHTIAVALEQYHDICREYPSDIISQATCTDLGPGSLESFINNIAEYRINDPLSDYQYIPLAGSLADTNSCTGYHLYAKLETDYKGIVGAKFNSSGTGNAVLCTVNSAGELVDAGTTPRIFDLHR